MRCSLFYPNLFVRNSKMSLRPLSVLRKLKKYHRGLTGVKIKMSLKSNACDRPDAHVPKQAESQHIHRDVDTYTCITGIKNQPTNSTRNILSVRTNKERWNLESISRFLLFVNTLFTNQSLKLGFTGGEFTGLIPDPLSSETQAHCPYPCPKTPNKTPIRPVCPLCFLSRPSMHLS